jgi:hypothetical protein
VVRGRDVGVAAGADRVLGAEETHVGLLRAVADDLEQRAVGLGAVGGAGREGSQRLALASPGWRRRMGRR